MIKINPLLWLGFCLNLKKKRTIIFDFQLKIQFTSTDVTKMEEKEY